MTPGKVSWLGLDVGGANIKAAHSSGLARSSTFELWKHPDDLPREVAALASTFPPYDRVALTMTAELCDCYPTKAVGVGRILDAIVDVAGWRPICVWGTDGAFSRVSEVRQAPRLAAASNWLALATVAARLAPDGPGLLIDIGSTTTDLIPLLDGQVAARGRTDTERLQTGELVYAGVRRTPVSALATELPHRGVATGLAAELFATTLDVYLTLGAIEPEPEDSATADGRPATVDSARDRLARMVGADRDDFTEDDAVSLAREADEALLARLADAAGRACLATAGRPRSVITAGSGEFLARRLARRVLGARGTIIGLQEAWGPIASIAGCAHALVVLAGELSEGHPS